MFGLVIFGTLAPNRQTAQGLRANSNLFLNANVDIKSTRFYLLRMGRLKSLVYTALKGNGDLSMIMAHANVESVIGKELAGSADVRHDE